MTLTVIPVMALLALWAFAMVSFTGDLRALNRLEDVYGDFATPVDTAVAQIQTERRVSARYLGAGPYAGTSAVADLTRQQRSTDRAVRALREAVDDDGEDLSSRERRALAAMDRAVDGLPALRARVKAREIGWDRAVEEYTAVIEPAFDVQSTLTVVRVGRLAREAQVVVELVRVREFVSREDALIAGARAAGRLTDRQYDTLTATIEDRRVFHRTYVPGLPDDSRKLFTEFEGGAEYRALVAQEETLLRAGVTGAVRAMGADSWQDTTDRAVQRYLLECTEASLNAADRGGDLADSEMAKSVAVGAAGLIAVGLTAWFSVVSGLRISRRLAELRDAADLLASRQLPYAMQRLRSGEDVDADEAAPPLAFDDAGTPEEIVQVGQSLNAARLVAVEAAGQQADLRRGVFTVLLNIARRSQALVHRQSKIVDTLEGRTTDPAALDDLFRIDHLTTRMRRHAEGLIILSGATPGRRWHKPVPLAEIVAAAVAEIEDYARVVVPPMPPVGVAAPVVADVIHLVAELAENAATYSPPHTQVTMRTGRVGNGFVLEIDDRGLGLDAEELDRVQRILARPHDFNPARDERLGLYVVGQLAERHGIGVTLTRSPYGGTTAVVLLPNAVIATAGTPGRRTGGGAKSREKAAERSGTGAAPATEAGTGPGPGAGTGPGSSGTGAQAGTGPGPGAAAAGRERSGHGTGGTGAPGAADPGDRPRTVRPVPFPRAFAPGEMTHERAGEEPAPGPVPPMPASPPPAAPPGRPGPAAAQGPRSVPAPPAGAAGARPPAAGRPPGRLPTRVRQASLAPTLRGTSQGESDGPEREVSAEEMRSIFGAFQQGLDRGRRGVGLGERPESAQTVPRTRTTEEGTDDSG
ncbi:nitrate- and nitrite sensing domain-containing protein [Streptomyces sp. NPDC051018]|uniref:sensor histidine kinase n=1 Tax=Streptomyces sp. NPDC051018 TaxID=3365639 RepID=UPI00379B1DB7